jgi:hypothetical protein
MNVFRHIPGYETHVYEPGKEALFLVFVSFLVAFFLTRLYTRQARIRSWGSASIGGVHLHHAVPGVVLVLIGGLLSFTPWGNGTPAQELLAIAFGVGAGFILDEFALLFYLRDVYWAEQGRSSIDAVIIGTSIGGILLLTASPFDVEAADYNGARIAVFTTIAVNYLLALICFVKGKPIIGAIGLLIPLVAFVGAIRLAKPHSPWSRWFYDPDRGEKRWRARRAAKLRRAQRRYEWLGRFERDVTDVIGGRPSAEPADSD